MFKEVGHAEPRARFIESDRPYLLEKLHEADSIYRQSGKLEDYSDLGALLVFTGQYSKAKPIFLEIEQKSPGLYETAANLGTVYELLGNNDSALYWIKKAVEINPKSHEGSEWIHVKILEMKVKAKGDVNYLRTHSILSLDFGNDDIPENKTGLNLEMLRLQLYYQLSERMSFVKPKDPVIAQLLFDLGNVCSMTTDVKSGLQVFLSAKAYGYTSSLFDRRQAYFERLQFKADLRNKSEGWVKENPMLALIIVGTLIVGGITGVIFLFRRFRRIRRKKRSRNSEKIPSR